MFKKIITTIVGISAILLALFYVIAMLLKYQDFFGPGITYVLVGCIAALMVFFVFLMISNIRDVLKRRDQEEDKLDEKNIEKIFTKASAVKQHVSRQGATNAKTEDDLEAEFEDIRKQAEYEAKKAAEAAAEKERKEKLASLQKADLEAKKQRIAQAQEEARQRAEEAPDEDDRKLAAAELEALQRAAVEAEKELKRQESAQRRAKAEQARREREEAEAAEIRKTQAIESVRRQAEAAAAARRRAAATAATQGFSGVGAPGSDAPAYTEPQSPVFTPIPVASAQPVPAPENMADLNLWERMAAPQAASQPISNPTLAQVPLPGNTGRLVHPGEGTVYETTGYYHTTPLSNSQQFGAPSGSANAVSTLAQKTAAVRAMGSTTGTGYVPAPPVAAVPIVEEKVQPVSTVPPEIKPYVPKVPAKPIAVPVEPTPPPVEFTPPPVVNRPSYDKVAEPVVQPADTSPLTQHSTAREPSPAAVKSGVTGSAQPELPRRRGRPPKPRTEEELNQPKRPRGRPPKPRTEDPEKPKRPRGRPPKPKTADELDKPKRPRGRPPKDPAAAAAKMEKHAEKLRRERATSIVLETETDGKTAG